MNDKHQKNPGDLTQWGYAVTDRTIDAHVKALLALRFSIAICDLDHSTCTETVMFFINPDTISVMSISKCTLHRPDAARVLWSEET